MSSSGDYPPDLWQVGEKIRQRIEIEIPRLLALPGTYDLLIFVKHKSTNLSARVAKNKPENRGLKVRGGKKEALRIAQYIY